MTITRTRLPLVGAAVVTMTAAAAITWAALDTRSAPDPAAGAHDSDAVSVGHAADHLPNASATDWVSYADHVVLVSPVSEQVVPPTATELERGEGLIGRTLQMRVDEVLWSAAKRTPAPTTFDWQAFGWQFRDGNPDARVPLAAEDAPRFEVGHQYVLAIRWEEARCSEGDQVPAQWAGLGADAMVPADGGVIGQGELEGETQTVAEARSAAALDGLSLEDQLVGGSTDDLTAALKAATPQPPSALTYVATDQTC